jgi:hypothetical protein
MNSGHLRGFIRIGKHFSTHLWTEIKKYKSIFGGESAVLQPFQISELWIPFRAAMETTQLLDKALSTRVPILLPKNIFEGGKVWMTFST